MTVENVTYINSLNPANPSGVDKVSEGDDHIRNIKKALLASFPNVNSEVTLSATDINGLLSRVQDLEAEVQDLGNNATKQQGLASVKFNGTDVKYGYNVDRVEALGNGAYRIHFISAINADGNLTSGDFAGVVTPYTTNGLPVIGYITDQREAYVDVGFKHLSGGNWENPTTQGFGFMLIDQVPG